MEFPRFTLLPWEFPGAPGSRDADAVTTTMWRGKEVVMRLKVRENRLFFAPIGEKGGRLWAVYGPLAKSARRADSFKSHPAYLIQKFEEAMSKGLWGRVVLFHFNPSYVSHEYPISLSYVMATVRRDGKIELRLIYADDFIPTWTNWESAPRFGLHLDQFEIWPHATLSRYLLTQVNLALRLPAGRDISPTANRRASIPLYFLFGSHTELETLIRAASHLYGLVERIPNPYAKRPYYQIISGGGVCKRARIYTSCSYQNNPHPALKLLFPLFLQLHYPIGQTFSTKNKKHDKEHFPFYIKVHIEPPTHHERLEAYATLRELTRGTKIEAAVNAVLAEYPPQI